MTGYQNSRSARQLDKGAQRSCEMSPLNRVFIIAWEIGSGGVNDHQIERTMLGCFSINLFAHLLCRDRRCAWNEEHIHVRGIEPKLIAQLDPPHSHIVRILPGKKQRPSLCHFPASKRPALRYIK